MRSFAYHWARDKYYIDWIDLWSKRNLQRQTRVQKRIESLLTLSIFILCLDWDKLQYTRTIWLNGDGKTPQQRIKRTN